MGLKPSKRQSYTPGSSADAGLPTAAVENGEIKSGANGQVKLISNREGHPSASITADVTPASSPSPTSPTDKKKRRTPRFVFNRKRTGSGRRSKKNRKETNGIRPTSYPPALNTSNASAASAADADADADVSVSGEGRRAQSMYVEEVVMDVESHSEAIITSSHDEEKEAHKASPSKRSSSGSTSSPSKSSKKKNSSHKDKSPKKKEKKDSKKKSDKKKKGGDADKALEVEEEKMEAAAAVIEEVVFPELETVEEQIPSLQTPGPSLQAEVTADLAPSLQTSVVAEPGKEDDHMEMAAEDGVDRTAEQTTEVKEAMEATIGLTVAAMSETPVKLASAEDATEEPEPEPEPKPGLSESTAEQIFAEIERTIINKEKREAAEEKSEERKETEQTEFVDHVDIQAEEHINVQTSAEEVELAGQVIHEDILELDEISNQTKETAEQELPKHVEEAIMDVAVDKKVEATGNTTEVVEAVTEHAMVVEIQSTVEAAGQEPVSETIQQQVEALVESTPITVPEDEGEQEQEMDMTQLDSSVQSNEESQNVTQSSENLDTSLDVSASEAPAAEAPSQPTVETAPQMTKAQLKALEKERKAAQKREEKERAKREKEEKKRLKEEKKREAREKKQREKEEKERKLREARQRAKVTSNMPTEVKPNEMDQQEAQTAATEAQAAAVPEEETVTASHSEAVEAAPSTTISVEMNQQVDGDNAVAIETIPSTSTDVAEVKQDDKVDIPDFADFSSMPSATPALNQKNAEDGMLGCSVKEIITTIENHATMDTKTYDENNPPEVPDAPYPDEEEAIQATSAVTEFSSPPSSPADSAPTSPGTPDIQDQQGDVETTLEEAALNRPISVEIGEVARSSVLRKIELGPRLRTAILRKSSSGTESDGKRVSLTQPRHVQVSDLTPPPRKPRVIRRPLDHSPRVASGDYTNVSYSSGEPVVKEPESEPVIEEPLTGDTASSSESSPSPDPAEEKEEQSDISGEGSQGAEVKEVKEQMTVVTTSLSQSAQFISSSHIEDRAADEPDNIQIKDHLLENLTSQGSGASIPAEPESPELASMANIVFAGQTESSHSADLTHQASKDVHVEGEEREQGKQADGPEADPSLADDHLLHKVASDVVVKVQKAAQEKASALELEEKMVLQMGSTDVGVTPLGDGDDCVQGGEDSQVVKADRCQDGSDRDSDGEMCLVHATVVCSAELVSPSSDSSGRCDASPKDCDGQSPSGDRRGAPLASDSAHVESGHTQTQVCHGATGTSATDAFSTVINVKTGTVSVEPVKHESLKEETEASSSSAQEPASSSSGLKADENVNSPTEDAPDTSQLQLFNKNYYGIAAVVDDDDDDDDHNVPKTPQAAGRQNELPLTSQLVSSPYENVPSQPFSQQTVASSAQGGSFQAGEVSCSLMENGDVHAENVHVEDVQQPSEQEGKVKVSVHCNGSRAHHVQKEEDGPMEMLLRLQTGLNGEKDVLCETLEHNNNISTEEKSAPEPRAESAASASTSDSRD